MIDLLWIVWMKLAVVQVKSSVRRILNAMFLGGISECAGAATGFSLSKVGAEEESGDGTHGDRVWSGRR